MNIYPTFYIDSQFSPLKNAKPVEEWSEVQRMRLDAWMVIHYPWPAAVMTDTAARAILGVKRLPSPKRKAPEPASTGPELVTPTESPRNRRNQRNV